MRPNPAGISSAVVSKLERRTITPRSIVPRLESCFQRWLLTITLCWRRGRLARRAACYERMRKMLSRFLRGGLERSDRNDDCRWRRRGLLQSVERLLAQEVAGSIPAASLFFDGRSSTCVAGSPAKAKQAARPACAPSRSHRCRRVLLSRSPFSGLERSDRNKDLPMVKVWATSPVKRRPFGGI